MSSIVQRYGGELDYELATHEKVLRSLDSVPEERRGDDDYRKAVDLYAHVLQSRRLWLARFDGGTDTEPDWFPAGASLEELEHGTREVHDAWAAYLAERTDEDLQRPFRYASWEGDSFENTPDDVLNQLRGHSFYHRGQIAQLVRRLGGRPAVAEYVLFTRRPV